MLYITNLLNESLKAYVVVLADRFGPPWCEDFKPMLGMPGVNTAFL